MGWWFSEAICSSNWIISPGSGKHPETFETTTYGINKNQKKSLKPSTRWAPKPGIKRVETPLVGVTLSAIIHV